MKLSRRQFLTALAGASVAPTLWLPRTSRAQMAAQQAATAQQLLVIYCGGGMRSHALFSFPGAPLSLNPFGVDTTPTKATFRLASPKNGNTDTAPFQQNAEFLPGWGRNLPTLFGSTSEQFSLVGPVDHAPMGPPVVDLQQAMNLISTGNIAGGPGIFTIIGNAFATSRPLPPFIIGDAAAQFGAPAPGLTNNTPVFIHDPLDLGADDNPNARMTHAKNAGAVDAWELAMRRSLDDELHALLPTLNGYPVELTSTGREQLRAVQAVLSKPQLQFKNADTESAAFEVSNGLQLSNRLLEQAFLPFIRFQSGGLTPNSDFSDPLGAKMALAVRLLQYGSPAVVVGYDGFDLHKNEDALLHTVSRPLGRALSGLLLVLAGLPGNVARRRLDETLIMVVSEWGRDSVDNTTGFNSENGSDHRGDASSRFQVLPVAGAVASGGGHVIGGYAPTTDLTPTSGQAFASAQLGATMLSKLGIDWRKYISVDPIDGI